MEWLTSSWTCIHTGHPSGNAGVLILVSRRLCPTLKISWAAVHAGRLLHVRLHMGLRHYHVLGIYQWPHNPANKPKRQAFLNQLSQLLDSLPRRNQLALLGDFNTAVSASGGVAGTSSYAWQRTTQQGAQHTDSGALAQVLHIHELCVLNAWNQKDGPTFHGPISTSRIDFIMCRQRQLDGQAKATRQLRDMPMIPASNGHTPIVATLLKCWIPYKSAETDRRFTFRHRMLSRQLHIAQDPAWIDMLAHTQQQLAQIHTDQLHSLQLHSSSAPSSQPPDATLHRMHTALSESFHDFVQTTGLLAARTPAPPDQLYAVVETKWQYWKHMRSLTIASLTNVFHAWRCWSRFHALQRTQAAAAKRRKMDKLNDLTMRASQAAMKHDLFGLYHVINKFTPKQRKSRIQLRSHDGAIASPVEEMSILRAYVTQTWFDSDAPQLPLPFTPFLLKN
eukprot:s1225_g14.t1